MKLFKKAHPRHSEGSAGPAVIAVSLLSLLCILIFHFLPGSIVSQYPGSVNTEKALSGNSSFTVGQAYTPFDIFHMENSDFSAVIVSDLHYSSGVPLISSGGVSRQDNMDAFTRTLLAEVEAIRPDILILCGDNTDLGDLSSMESLSSLLQETEKAGIPVALCPGNHDYSLSSAADYSRLFAPLMHADSLDTDSLSYSRLIGICRLLVMDDNLGGNGIYGAFSDQTIGWLDSQLEAAEASGEFPILITHHNIFRGSIPEHEDNYVIQNEDLPGLLEQHHVRLVFSGHRHGQEIIHPETSSVYEIVSGFPSAYPFYFGVLKIEDGTVSYQAQSIDFQNYGADYGMQGLSGDSGNLPDMQQTFSDAIESMLEEKTLSRNDREKIRDLFLKFTDVSLRGELALYKQEILEDPSYHKMMMAIKDTNYGRWVQYAMEHTELPGTYLSLELTQDL